MYFTVVDLTEKTETTELILTLGSAKTVITVKRVSSFNNSILRNQLNFFKATSGVNSRREMSRRVEFRKEWLSKSFNVWIKWKNRQSREILEVYSPEFVADDIRTIF